LNEAEITSIGIILCFDVIVFLEIRKKEGICAFFKKLFITT